MNNAVAKTSILALNGGSSSIRFALYEAESLRRLLDGKVDRVGSSDAAIAFEDHVTHEKNTRPIAALNPHTTADSFVDWLEDRHIFSSLAGVGHRVVHGMTHSEPERITPELLDELRRLTQFDPDHLPAELELIEAVRRRHSDLPQVGCFDTAFHRTMPEVARRVPIPRRYAAKGVERYGFHGLSYAFLVEELVRLGDAAASKGPVILAHLGSGASLCALRDGKSIDTSMGFSPTSGLVMGTRSGDLDPALVSFLAETEQMTPAQFQRMVNHDSGMLGVSETTSDLRDLLAREADDPRAAEAIDLFCYQVRKWIGAYCAALGGLATLVFSGGIGENSPEVRRRICEHLTFLGIELDETANAENASVISTTAARVTVRVIRTDEEQMVARSVVRILGLGKKMGGSHV